MYQIFWYYGRKKKMAYKQELWGEAKKKCYIRDEEIRMASFLRKLRNGEGSIFCQKLQWRIEK